MNSVRRELSQSQWLSAMGIDPFWIVDAPASVPAQRAQDRQPLTRSDVRQADWLLVADMPDADLSGQNGKLLDAMLAALSLKRDDGVHLTQVFQPQMLETIRPKIIIALGQSAAAAVLGSDLPLGSARGRLHHHAQDDLKIPVVVTYSPGYLLGQPEEKWKTWQDLLLAKAALISE